MSSPDQEKAKQGIEFWTSIAETEIDLKEELEEAQSNNQTPSAVSKHYTLGALDTVAPLLLQCMTVQVWFIAADNGGMGWAPSALPTALYTLFFTDPAPLYH